MAKTVVQIEHASVRYNLATQKQRGLKDYVKAIMQRKLLFQEFIALKDVNLTVHHGESWGFVGKNGSGKSTLLKLITGILRPYEGDRQRPCQHCTPVGAGRRL